MDDKITRRANAFVDKMKSKLKYYATGSGPHLNRTQVDPAPLLLGMSIINLVEDAYRQGRRDERKHRKASCARRWKQKQADWMTTPHHVLACQCIANTPYQGSWHKQGCPLWASPPWDR